MRSISHRLVIDYTPQTLSSNIFSQSISDVKIYVVFDDNNSEKGIELACQKTNVYGPRRKQSGKLNTLNIIIIRYNQ